ncbi:MAG TPA: outer membrane protein assembly factor BamA [Terriglobia bacterium]|jgi:outer membrane protein insertion porin family
MGLTVWLALSVAFFTPQMTDNLDLNRIEDVRVTNNHRIPAESIRFQLQTKPGGRFSLATVDGDIRRLYAMGNFDNIRVDYAEGKTGRIVVFWIQEKKTIRTVKYEGLSAISNSEIVERLKEKNAAISQESTYDPGRIRKAENVIKMALAEKGHEDATVKADSEDVPPNSVALTFKVDEGPLVRVQKITIEGNNVFTGRQIKNVMRLVKESDPINSILGRDTYFDLKLADDLTRIRMLYAEHGYVRTNVADPIVETKPHPIHRTFPLMRPSPFGIPIPFSTRTLKRYYITIKIEENNQYRLGNISVSGNRLLDEAKIQSALGLNSGDVFDEVKLRDNFLQLKKLYGSKGYVNFTAVPLQAFDEPHKIVNLAVNVEEDKPYTVDRITFTGNTTTRDKVIRREIMIDEGQVFDSALWDMSMQRLNQLAYFDEIKPEDADIKLNQNPPTVDIHLKVKEKQRNLIGVTGGISGIGGSFVGLNYESNNFAGSGDTLGLTAQAGTLQSQYRLSFTQPYLFDRPWTAGFSVFTTKFTYDQSADLFGLAVPPSSNGETLNFEQKETGINLSSSHPIRVWNRAGLTLGLTHSQTTAINSATEDFFGAVKTETDQSLTIPQTGTNFSNFHAHSLTPSFISNHTKGLAYAPSRGWSLSTTFEYAGGPLGGTVNYFRPAMDFRYFHPINRGRNTIAMRFTTAYIHGFSGTSVPYYQRLFLGGDFDIRGFDFREITPIAYLVHNVTTTNAQGVSVTQPGDDVVYVGGDTQAVLNLEYRIPIVGQIVTLAPFFDAGNAWVIKKGQLTRKILNSDGTFTALPVKFLPGTNSGIRTSTGIELQILLPVIRAPFRIIYAENPNRINGTFSGQLTGAPFTISEKANNFKFTIGRTF